MWMGYDKSSMSINYLEVADVYNKTEELANLLRFVKDVHAEAKAADAEAATLAVIT